MCRISVSQTLTWNGLGYPQCNTLQNKEFFPFYLKKKWTKSQGPALTGPLNQDYGDEILFGVETPFWCNKRNESCEKIGRFLDLPSHSQAVLPGVESGAGALSLWRLVLHFLLQADGNSEHSKRKLPLSSPKHKAMLKVGGKDNRNSSNSLWIICSSLTLSMMLVYMPHLSSF